MNSRDGEHIMCFSPLCGWDRNWGDRRVVLVYKEHDTITPYVVSVKYDKEEGWCQGHYFTCWEDAAEFFAEHSAVYLRRHTNAV